MIEQVPVDRRAVGYLLIGHGTRSGQGTEEFWELKRMLAEHVGGAPVEAGFLELQNPTIHEAWDRLIQQGVEFVQAMPLLLFAAGHALQDIPQELQQCASASRSQGRAVRYVQTPPLELNRHLVELSHTRACQAIPDGLVASRSAWVFVGRGSTDASASAQMQRFVQLRAETHQPAIVRTAFLAMAQPELGEVLEEVSRLSRTGGIDDVVVQPHLLFQGALTQRIKTLVSAAAESAPHLRWHLTEHLGPHRLLVDALIDLAPTRAD